MWANWHTWQAVENGKQTANEDHITALSKIWPEYKYWLVFNETMPEAGQISPEIEETRQNLLTGRYRREGVSKMGSG